jgi:hypothetical protein
MPPREDWLTIPGWAGYEVSSRGRVRSVGRQLRNGQTTAGQLLKPAPDKDGYRYVTLADGQRRWRVGVHRLVLLAHAGTPATDDLEGLHGNGRRWDNRLANLRWGTRPENRADRERHREQREARRAEREGTGVTGGTSVMVEGPKADVAGTCPEKGVPASPENRRSR